MDDTLLLTTGERKLHQFSSSASGPVGASANWAPTAKQWETHALTRVHAGTKPSGEIRREVTSPTEATQTHIPYTPELHDIVAVHPCGK